MATNFEIYAELWKRAEQIGTKKRPSASRAIYVHEARATSEASSFDEKWGNGPALQIHNPDRTEPTAKPVNDGRVLIKLISLAHEMGHATSYSTNADGAWAEYSAARDHMIEVQGQAVSRLGDDASREEKELAANALVRVELTDQERELIWREENRAWRISETLLRETTFDNWAAFERRRAAALRSHALRLGREDPHPGELALRPIDLE